MGRISAAVLAVALLLGCSPKQEAVDNEEYFKPKKPFRAFITVTGVSMQGSLPDANVRRIDFAARYDDLQPDDVVLLWDYKGEQFVLHHTLTKVGTQWRVKGSNPETNYRADDFWLTRSNYIGKYIGERTDR